MSLFNERAREQLPSVILTLLSIVQALALELLWSWLRSHDYLYAFNATAVTGWLQVLTTFVGILLIWLIYVSNALRFRWSPRTDDLILPFVIGVIEFTLVDTIGPDTLGAWFCAQALVFAVMVWVTQTLLRRARLDGGNDAYFRHFKPATLRNFAGPMVIVGLMLITGVCFWIYAPPVWLSMLAVAALLSVLVVQGVSVDHYYRRSQRV